MSSASSRPALSPAGSPAGPLAWIGRRWREFAGAEGDATYFWTRWLVLRAVGVVFLFVFAGIISQAQAIIAPNGIAQLGEFFAQAKISFPSPIEAFLRAPSLFWLNTSPAMITTLAWAGMAAAIAVVLNLCPGWRCSGAGSSSCRSFRRGGRFPRRSLMG